jgi:uncharacterized protein YfiM (DUF2279 family)
MKSIVFFVSILVGMNLEGVPLKAQYRVSLSPISDTSHHRHAVGIVGDSKERLYEADKWVGSDKVKHFGASFLLVVLGKVGSKELLKFDRAASSVSAVGTALLVGFAKEIIDDLDPKNIFSLKDLIADLLGIAVALFLLLPTGY